ncbi:FecR family protein [uncultured Zobellia sp.]|uniref:FecR family protein n=1 Tax=uncultured Zobellia sp. TaxID=255433 RepID=UPI002598D53B|nr:FecR family protein [uncultured Zobellia sp.]
MDFKLILKKINNILTAEENKIFEAWHSESKVHRDYFNKVKNNYSKGIDIVDIQKGWADVSIKINKKKKGYLSYKYAAAVVLLFSTILTWYWNTENSETTPTLEPTVVHKKQIHIGSDKATLTLEDGSEILLKKGESFETDKASSNGEQLVYNKSRVPEKSTSKNILTIPKGGQFFLVLNDGTKVWVNSGTQIKYPVAFTTDKTREIELVYGEAYFDVSPSTEHNGSHFIVKTEGQKIEVLGTEFNIKAYDDDDHISTTLVEGKVLVKNGDDSKNLTPGHQSKIDRSTNKLVVSAVDVYNEISWKDGLFSFKNQSLEDIMKVLSRWYNVDVAFENKSIKKLTFNGIFRKNLKLDQILKIIQNTNEVNYEIKEKTITMK